MRRAARHIQHMQKALHQMNLVLDKVISDITGVTGPAIIEPLLVGERNPVTLAQLRDCRIWATEDDIVNALQGDYREEHLFVLQQAYEADQFTRTQLASCDQAVEAWLRNTEKAIELRAHPLPPATRPRRKPQGNEPTYDARGVRL